MAIICVLLYFVLGACFNLWHPTWIVFLFIPLIASFIEALYRRNYKLFAYPVLVTIIYLFVGCCAHKWHPTWIVFITIPLYYVVGDFVGKSIKSSSADFQDKTDADVGDVSIKRKSASKAGQTVAGVLLTIVSVFVMITLWSAVISLFVGGIGMMIGGIGGIIWAGINMAASVKAGMIALGGSIATLGLGMVLTFGMSGLFKVIAKLCREMSAAIGRCFKKENA